MSSTAAGAGPGDGERGERREWPQDMAWATWQWHPRKIISLTIPTLDLTTALADVP